jgi:hypothetical protein
MWADVEPYKLRASIVVVYLLYSILILKVQHTYFKWIVYPNLKEIMNIQVVSFLISYVKFR